MIGLVGVEILKIRTTRRALLGWVATVVLLVGLLATAAAFAPPEEGGDPAQADVTVADVVGAAWLAAIVGLLLGIIAATNEWRHGTVAITFLVTPSAGRSSPRSFSPRRSPPHSWPSSVSRSPP